MNRVKIKFHQLIPTNFGHQTKEFFSNSTLHGVRYIAERGRPFGEKFMWFCCVAIGAVAAFVIIDSLWEKFQTNPTITGLDTDFHNQEMDFPTVAVCPLEPFDGSKVNETAYRTLADYESNYAEFIPLLEALTQYSYDSMVSTYELLKTTPKMEKELKSTLRQLAFKVAIRCEDLFQNCKFRGDDIPCCDYFSPVYTERGFCFAFNSRFVGTPEEEIKNTRINSLFETDRKWSVMFALNNPSKVYLHSIEEVSSYDIRSQFLWDESFSVDLLISMKQTYTTDDAKQLTVGQRKCIFQGEIDLNYYKNDIYSLTACMKQCRMQKADKLCKCIPPFYEPATGNYRECTLSDFKCLADNRNNITDIRSCKDCELSCLNTVYESEKFIKNTLSPSHKREDFRVNIEFLTWPIIRYKREVLFGWVDLLVSFGGIAGLFLGFSLLSGVEIVYYFTMRAGCMFVKNREKLYELQHEKESRTQARYDLSIKPRFKSSSVELRRSSSLSNILMVKPVAYGESYPERLVAPINDKINRLDFAGRLREDVPRVGVKKFIPRRRNIFQDLHIAPYATKIKPLDRNFKIRSHSQGRSDVIFYGYLP